MTKNPRSIGSCYLQKPLAGSVRWLVSVVLVFALATLGYAQTAGSSTLRGVVYDKQHAVIPNASVTLISEETGIARTATSGSDGNYYFTALTPGKYTLKVENAGFGSYKLTGIDLSATETRGQDVELQVGQTSEAVTVSAGAAAVETESGAIQYTLSNSQLDNLSLIGRNPSELLRVLPGVVAPSGTSLLTVSMQNGGRADAFTVSGHNGDFNRFTLDGSRIQNQGDTGSMMVVMNNDMLQEVRIQTSNYEAEYGSSGIQITGVTKSGSNGFHGSLYDYYRPKQLSANDRSNNYARSPRPDSTYQYIGGNIGGPLTKGRDKLFFFLGSEIQRQKEDDGSFFGVVPTAKQRTGDFSELLAAPAGKNFLSQPSTVKIPGTSNLAPNNNLSPYVTKVGTALANLYPLPNYVDPNNVYNYYGQDIYPVNRETEVLRLDYNVSANTRMFLRLAGDSESLLQPFGSWFKASGFPNAGQVGAIGNGETAALSLVHVFSPTVTNEVLFSAIAQQLVQSYGNQQAVALSTLGISDFVGLFPSTGLAPANVFASGQPGGTLRQQQNLPLVSEGIDYAITENLAIFKGKHAFKFGGNWEQFRIVDNNGSCQSGCVYVNSNSTPGSTGNDFGDLLTGKLNQFVQATILGQAHQKQNDFEFYAQDSWKVLPRLTVTYGLRLSFFPLLYDTRGRSTAFVPSAYQPSQGLLINGNPLQPNGVLISSLNGLPRSGIDSPGAVLGPRAGFAWDITGKSSTVIRGGFGLFYNRANINFAGSPQNTNPPFGYSVTVTAASAVGLGNGAGLNYDTIRQVNPYSSLGGVALTAQLPGTARVPETMSLSFSVDQKLPWDQVLQVSYVGVLGRHLAAGNAVDFIPAGALLKGTVGNSDLSVPVNRVALATAALNSFAPFPAYTGITSTAYNNTNNYHALQATLNKRISKRATYLVSYAFSKNLGTGTGGGSNASDSPFAAAVDPIDTRGRTYGVLGSDRTHILTLSYVYTLPKFESMNRVGRNILGGWQLSGIDNFQSGSPVKISLTGAIASAGIAQAYFGTNVPGALAPTYLGNPTTGNSGVGQALFDISKLSIPAYGSLGPYQPPYYLRTPFISNFDLTVFKEFPIGETKKIQFRLAAFNLFNEAFPIAGDINTSLATTCNKTVNGVPNGTGGTVNGVCDPSGGFSFNPTTVSTFGQIVTKHGHRLMEVVVKFYF